MDLNRMSMDKGGERRGKYSASARARMRYLLVCVFFAVLALCLYLGWSGLKRFFFTGNKYFVCREIKYEGGIHFTTKKIQTWLEELGEKDGCVLLRNNLLQVDIGGIRQKLLENPCIKQAEVRRVLPNTLLVKIEERTPFALLAGERNIKCAIDKDGVVFPYIGKDGTTEGLPYLMRVKDVDTLPMGQACNDVAVRASLFIIDCMASRQPVTGAEYVLKYININHELERLECCVEGFPGNEVCKKKTQLCFPFDTAKISAALSKLDMILADKVKKKETLSFADLTMENNVNTMN